MKTKLSCIYLMAVTGMMLIFSPGCEKDDHKDELEKLIYGSLTDTDGNVYKTVQIGWGEWMTENLRTTRYNDGTEIPTGLSPAEWSNTEEGAYAVYPHVNIDGLSSDAEVIDAYGIHYNWYAVETGNLCPAGWRVPTVDDWEGLLLYLTENYDEISNDNVGNFLKSCRQVDSPLGGDCATTLHPRWNMDGVDYFRKEIEERFPGREYPGPGFEYELSPLAGTDDFGFAAFPAGQYSGGIATGLGYRSIFWTSTGDTMEIPVTFTDQGGDIIISEEPVIPEEDETTIEIEVAYTHDINFGPGIRAFLSRSNGFPVRCVRGDLPAREPRLRYEEP